MRGASNFMYEESARAKSLAEWGSLCDVSAEVITQIAQEFTSHGKRAVCDPHRGVAQHTNGFYNALCAYTLNALVGNWDWKGGLLKATSWAQDGSKTGQPYAIGKPHPFKYKNFGISIVRH
jgi:anaerobic selenocysteine-containing dehydrogenase